MAYQPSEADFSEECLLEELLSLRKAVAQTLGRDQYLYQVLDTAIATGHGPTWRRAWQELNRQPADIRDRLLNADRPA